MKQDTVMQTGDKTKYKHVFVCGVAQSETSVLGRNIARLENCTGFKNTGQRDEGQFLQDVYLNRAGLNTNEVVALIVIERRRRCRWWRRSRSLASERSEVKAPISFSCLSEIHHCLLRVLTSLFWEPPSAAPPLCTKS